MRDWTKRNFEFSGYVTRFDPSRLGDRVEFADDDQEVLKRPGSKRIAKCFRRAFRGAPGSVQSS